MKAFMLDRYGNADRVRAGDVPELEPREDDVLVRVHAAGLNLLDFKIRNGEFKRILRYRLPLILGHDVAGVVVQVGSRVRRFKAGDEVYVLTARTETGAVGPVTTLGTQIEKNSASRPPSRVREMSMLPFGFRLPMSRALSKISRCVVSSCKSTTIARSCSRFARGETESAGACVKTTTGIARQSRRDPVSLQSRFSF